MELIAIISQISLALIAVWYTIETRKLRVQNQHQLKLLTKQVTLSLAPYIHVSLFNFKTALQTLNEEGEIPGEQTERDQFVNGLRTRFAQPNAKFISKISNQTTKLAIGVRVYVFDCHSKTFFRSEWGRTVLPEKDSIDLEILGDAVSLEIVRQELKTKYSESNPLFERHLTTEGTSSYIMVLFKDIEGNSYVVRREFEIDGNGIINGRFNELFLPGD